MSGIFDQVINYTPNSLITGGVIYKGTWSAASNTPTLTSPTDSTTLGSYYVVSEAGTRFSLDFNIGDWVISNGSTWQKVDNTDAVSSVFTRTGAVVAANGDYTASNITNVPSGNISAVTVQAALNELDGDISAAQEILTATVTNAESTAITRGQVVYVFSATGNRISVKLASNASEATSSKTFGVVTDASIAAGTTGLVTCVGTVSNLSIGSFTDGQTVYLGTAGAFTSTKPSAPAHLVYVGFIERANAGNGELYVKIQNGYELDELHDVAITGTPAAGSFIIRDATNSLWKNATLTAGTNIAVTNADAAVTVGLTGTVAVANGGTGVTTSTGSGNNVLSTSPTITSPTITGGALNGTLGATTPSTVAATTITTTSTAGIGGAATFNSSVDQSFSTASTLQLTQTNTNTGAGAGVSIFQYNSGTGAGGDTWIRQFAGTENWSFGVDNSDSSAWKVSRSGTLGTNDVLKLTSTGLNSTAIGATTPSTGAFSTLGATGLITASANGQGIACASADANGSYLGFRKSGTTYIGAIGAATQSAGVGTVNDVAIDVGGANHVYITTAETIRGDFTAAGLAVTGTLSATGAISSSAGSSAVPTAANSAFYASASTSNVGYAGTYFDGSTAFSSFLGRVPLSLSGINDGLGYVTIASGTPTLRALFSSTGLAITGTGTFSSTIGLGSGTPSANVAIKWIGSTGYVFSDTTVNGKHWQIGPNVGSSGNDDTWGFYSYTAANEILQLTTGGAVVKGTLSSTGNLSTTGDLRVTDTGSSHFILIGNQDSGGANKPNIIRGVNGTLSLGYGTSWSSSGGGTLTSIADISSTGLAVTGTLSTTGSVAFGIGIQPSIRIASFSADQSSSTYSLVCYDSNGFSKFSVRGDGAVAVAGALSKGSGSFRIEHPLPSKSATHQLVHSFIEGPKCDLIYRGKVNLVSGKASVNIDTDSTMTEGTFEVLCANVQCFTSNESGWGAIRGKVVGNILTIEAQDAASTDNVSWMVIGERKDKHILDTEWTDSNGRPIVEPLKPV